MLPIVLICASFLTYNVIADCSTPPIYLDIQTRNVEGSNDAISYGAYINVGSPIQQLSLWPSLDINEITLADAGFCSNSSCSASSTHGFYDPSKSTSFQNAPPTQLDNASVLTRSLSMVAETGTDVLHLWEDLMVNEPASGSNISSFPLQILSNYTSSINPFFGPGGLAGLGPSSTMLEYLLKAGKIAYRSYGLFLGSAYPRNSGFKGVNGSLTLGGYDAARFQEPIQSFSVTPDTSALTPFKLHLSGLTVTNTTSPPLEMFANDDIYLSTSQYEIVLPSSIAKALGGALDTTIINNTLGITTGPNSNLIFRFGTNFSISILSSPFLLSSPIKFSDSGPYILGSAFLSQVYLAVSYDSTLPVFYLAPTTQDSMYVNPKTLCPNTAPVAQATPHISPFLQNGLIGLIIGATIGGGALLVLIFIQITTWLQHRKRKQAVRFVNLKKSAVGGEELEMGNMAKTKTSPVHIVEKMGRSSEQEEEEDGMFFEPPPKRATVIVGEGRKMGLKGILKVRVPQ